MKSLVIHPADKSTDFLKPIYAHLRDKTVITNEDFSALKTIKEYFNNKLVEWTGYSSDDPPDDDEIDYGSGTWYSTRDKKWKRSKEDDSPYAPAAKADEPVTYPKREDFDNEVAWQNYWKDRFEKAKKNSIFKTASTVFKKWKPEPRDLSTIVPAKNPFDRFIMMGHGSPWGLFSMTHKGMLINDDTARLLTPCSQNVYIWCNADQYVKGNKLRGFYTGMFISEVGEAKYCGLKDITQAQVDESNNAFAQIVGKYINESVQSMHMKVRKEYGVLAEKNPVAEYNWQRLYVA
jgi:hypothetical protein